MNTSPINKSVLRALFALGILDTVLWIAWYVSFIVDWPEPIVNSLLEAAIVFAITAIITSIFERIVLSKLAEELITHTSEETKQLSREISPIVRATDDSGITKIFPERRSSVVDVLTELRRATGVVRIAGVALPDFFHPHDGDYFAALYDMLQHDRAEVRALLLDPESEAAKERDEIEIFYPLVGEIRTSCEIIDNFSEKNGWKIERRCYKHRPIAFILCTDRYLFMEQYHCAIPPNITTGHNIAGMVPLIQYRHTSATYQTMLSHFDFVWEHPNV